MENKELKALLKILRDNGVTEYKSNDINIKLDPASVPATSKTTKEDITPDQQFSEDDLIDWSSSSAS